MWFKNGYVEIFLRHIFETFQKQQTYKFAARHSVARCELVDLPFLQNVQQFRKYYVFILTHFHLRYKDVKKYPKMWFKNGLFKYFCTTFSRLFKNSRPTSLQRATRWHAVSLQVCYLSTAIVVVPRFQSSMPNAQLNC